jgi:type II secretory pathway predicted ATPase ExeA
MPERSRERFTRDPFAITPDPEVYVPRVATETAREQLLRSACNSEKTTALIGPPGLGKTLLLHLLAREVPEDVQTVYLPYAALPPAELCDWAIRLLALPAADDPIEALRAFGGDLREQGRSLLISIDDAGALPLATARWAGEFVRNSNGSVRLALAAADNDTGNRAIAAIGSNFDIVHLSDPMTESETRNYIDGRLALAGVPDSIRARFDDRTVSRLHRVSNGIPRRLHTAAAEVLQETPAADADDGANAPSAPVGVPSEPTAPAQTLGVPRGERRQSQRCAEPPEGVAVRIGSDGRPAEKGRRASDRFEVSPEVSESAAEGFAEPEPIERAEFDERPISDRESETALASPRRAPSRRTIALTSLLVVFAAVAIPVIRSTLSEPPQVAVIEPSASAARAEEPRIAEPPAVEPPPPEPAEMLAVQINASPWANIEVDGIDLGATPLANIPLLAGEHSFRAKMPDGRVIERTIEIDAERRFITFE